MSKRAEHWSGSAQVERTRAQLQRSVAVGADERLIAFYAWDFAGCDCPPTHDLFGVPCIAAVVSIAPGRRLRKNAKAPVFARCAGCGARWQQRDTQRPERAGRDA